MGAAAACVNTTFVVSWNRVRLRAADLEGVLRFLDDANNFATDEFPFPEETLAVLAELVPCDAIGVFEVDRVRRRNYPLDGEQYEQWWEVAHEHPICTYVEESGDFRALKVSDFLTRTQLHRLGLYDYPSRPLARECQRMRPLRSPPRHARAL